jgi:hypothetical protein
MRWLRSIGAAAVAIVVTSTLALMAATPAQAAATCYNNGHPDHRFIVCVDDGLSSHVWGWGQYDIRYYSGTLVALQGNPTGREADWVNVHTEADPYEVFIFVASIKTAVDKIAEKNFLRSLGFVFVRACMSAIENGQRLGRCSGQQLLL